LERAAASDDLSKAVDYARVAERARETGTSQEFHLLETLADRLATVILAEFPVAAVRLWVRKLAPPLEQVKGSVGVRLERRRSAEVPDPAPAAFLLEQMHLLPKGAALDVACGSGRNALFLAGRGYAVDALDRDQSVLASLASVARERNLTGLSTRAVDFESGDRPPDIARERWYDVVLVFFYLHRPLFPALIQAIKPGGVLIYETFLIDNHLRYQHPRRREFCLERNELLRLVPGLRVLHYDEGEHADARTDRPAFTARLVARKETHG
jgi:SAM-dependent methyltransferase